MSQMSRASRSGGSPCASSPPKYVAYRFSAGNLYTSVSSSHANAMASFLKKSPNDQFPSISKNVWWYVSFPTSSRSLCFPPARMHFCVSTARLSLASGPLGSALPRKMGLNWFIPAFANSNVGSSCGTTGEEGTNVWSLFLKKSKNVPRILRAGHPLSSYLPPAGAGAGAGPVWGPAASYAMGVTHLGTTPTASTNSRAANTDSSHASVAGNASQSAGA